MSAMPFSFQELGDAGSVDLADLQLLNASDGITLAYRCYAPAAPGAVLLFYHGGGAHSGAGYQYLGNGLQAHFNTSVYMPDIRGHGASGGKRGDTPAPQQVWNDITTFIMHIRSHYPQLPVFLGGHSSGAGLVLNYTSQAGHAPVDGYVFLAPEFGFRSKTGRSSLEKPFAMVNILAFIINAMSGGRLASHAHAVRFNYPPAVLAADKALLASNTVSMALAITPSAPQQQIANLDHPFGLWIGAQDELLDPDKVVAFADLAMLVRSDSAVVSINGAKHLSVLIKAHEAIGPWIEHRAKSLERASSTATPPTQSETAAARR